MNLNLHLDDNYPDVLELKREPEKILRIPKSMAGAGKPVGRRAFCSILAKKRVLKYKTWVTHGCCWGFMFHKREIKMIETRNSIHLEWTPW